MTSDPTFIWRAAWTEKRVPIAQDDCSIAESDVRQEQYCLEMFRRALSDDDLQAKAQFQHQLGKTVLRWVRLHPKKEMVCQRENEEYYMAQAFVCFWRVVTQRNAIEFGTFTTVLQYLQASVNGVMLDAVRASMRPEVTDAIRNDTGDEIWQKVQCLLSDTRQQRIAYLLFHCGFKPKEIVQSYPEEFGDMLEIARIRFKIIEGMQG